MVRRRSRTPPPAGRVEGFTSETIFFAQLYSKERLMMSQEAQLRQEDVQEMTMQLCSLSPAPLLTLCFLQSA